MIIYLAPDNPLLDEGYKKVSKAYMNPIFSQRWGFFSPNPGIEDVEFEYNCVESNKPIEWINLEEERLSRHQSNRLLGLGRVLYLTKGLAEQFLRLYEQALKSCTLETSDKENCANIIKQNIKKTREYYHINVLFSKKCSRNDFKGYNFRIKLTKPLQFSKRNVINQREYTYLHFPVVTYKKEI